MRAFRVAYDGRPFYGFQRQPDVRTVEGTIFRALDRLGIFDVDDDHRPPNYAAAGRTDAGVSALAQTIAFDAPEWCTPRALNSELPGSVRAWAAAEVPAEFHATHWATRREYTYYLFAPREGRYADAFDDDVARDAIDALSGEHDFHNLTTDERKAATVRRLDAHATREGDFFVLHVAAGGFARELVRRLVTLVQSVATGSAPFEKVARALGPESLDPAEGVGPAPATPLVLSDVRYPDATFVRDEEASVTVREVFSELAADGRVKAAVADHVLDGLADDGGR